MNDYPNSLRCSQDLFDRLWASRGSYCSDDDAIELAYEALGDTVAMPLSIYYIHFPDAPEDLLSDWGKLEYWLEDIHLRLSIESIWTPTFDYWEDNAPAPVTVFPTVQSLKSAVLELVKRGEHEESFPSLWGATITDGKRTVEIVYDDMDAWGLGHVDRIDVFDSIDDMTEENGYYAL